MATQFQPTLFSLGDFSDFRDTPHHRDKVLNLILGQLCSGPQG